MLFLSYLFEEKQSLLKYAFSPEGIKTTSTGIVNSTKNLGRYIAHKFTNLGEVSFASPLSNNKGGGFRRGF